MEAKELMVGDYVKCNPHCPGHRVDYISELEEEVGVDGEILSLDMIEPIPITREILEKNGFVYRKNSGAFIVYAEESYSNQTVEVTLFNVESEFRNNQLHICESYGPQETMLHLMECNYVHELQHALKVCGIEKEIEL